MKKTDFIWQTYGSNLCDVKFLLSLQLHTVKSDTHKIEIFFLFCLCQFNRHALWSSDWKTDNNTEIVKRKISSQKC